VLIKKIDLNKENINFRRFEDEFQNYGWDISKENDSFFMKPIMLKKLLSSNFSSLFIEGLELKQNGRKLSIYMKANLKIILATFAIYVLLIAKVLFNLDSGTSYSVVISSFVLILAIFVMIFILTLRSSAIRDIKKVLKELL